MPRIRTWSTLRAQQLHPLIRLLLRECRTLDSACNEFRWLREKALDLNKSRDRHVDFPRMPGWRTALRSMCLSRSRGMPLQYILGDQPFGDLDIICRRGVLIPRSETESITIRTAEVICQKFLRNNHPNDSPTAYPLQIMDLCSGTGCMSLLLHCLLASQFKSLSIIGIDISAKAIRLARDNLLHNYRSGHLSERAITEIQYFQGDILCKEGQFPGISDILRMYFGPRHMSNKIHSIEEGRVDVLVANPPYISPTSFRDGTTARSVRKFEPTLALVPPSWSHPLMAGFHEEDLFYRDIVLLSLKLQPRLIVFECGDRTQAARVSAASWGFATCCGGFLPIVSSHIWPSDSSDAEGNSASGNEACAVFLHLKPRQQ